MKKIILSAIVLLGLIACNNKQDNKRVNTVARVASGTTTNANGTTNLTTGSITTSCPNTISPIGTIYGSTSSQPSLYDSGNFETNVKLFLSATVDPNEVGTISSNPSDNTGVRFQGIIKKDQNGNVTLNQSKIIIKVYDSLLLQNSSLQAIPVEINGASSGQFNPSTGTGYIVFKDQYGEIRLEGRYDANSFSGTVSYVNYTTVIQNQSPASGQLGQFHIASCSIFQ